MDVRADTGILDGTRGSFSFRPASIVCTLRRRTFEFLEKVRLIYG